MFSTSDLATLIRASGSHIINTIPNSDRNCRWEELQEEKWLLPSEDAVRISDLSTGHVTDKNYGAHNLENTWRELTDSVQRLSEWNYRPSTSRLPHGRI